MRPFRSGPADAGQEHEVLAPHCRPLQSAIDPQHGLELLLDDSTRADLGDELLVGTLQLNHVARLLPAEEVAGANLLLVELVRHGQVHLGAPLVHQPRDLLVELVVVPVDGLPVLAIALGVHLRVVDELTHLEVVPVVPDELTRSQRLVPEQVELPAIGKPPFRCHERPQAVAQELNGVPNLLLIPVLNQTLELEDPLLEPAHDGDSANHHLASLRPVELTSCEAFRDVRIRLRGQPLEHVVQLVVVVDQVPQELAADAVQAGELLQLAALPSLLLQRVVAWELVALLALVVVAQVAAEHHLVPVERPLADTTAPTGIGHVELVELVSHEAPRLGVLWDILARLLRSTCGGHGRL